MSDFLKYGLDPSAGISIKDVDEDKKNFLLHGNDPVSEDDYTSYLSLSEHDIFLADSLDVVQLTDDNPEWAKGEMGSSEEFEDFADAVAGIPEDGPAMEQ